MKTNTTSTPVLKTSIIDAVVADAQFKVAQRIIQSSIRAKLALGYPNYTDHNELEALSYSGPRYIASVRIYGWSEEPMYDEAPHAATYMVEIVEEVDIGEKSLTRAMEYVTPVFLREVWFGQSFEQSESSVDVNDDAYDSETTGFRSVALLDNLGYIVAKGNVVNSLVKWDEPLSLQDISIDSIMSKIKELKSEAAFEAGWDNFSTSKSLSDQALQLQHQLEIAQNRANVVV